MASVVLIPGVGLGGWAFDRVGAFLGEVPHRVIDRPAEPMDVVDQADAIAAAIATTEGSAFVVGVSGGATVGLALAARHPAVVAGALLHEPLIGSRAPALQALINDRAERAPNASADERRAMFVSLIGEQTWAGLTASQREGLDLDRVAAELGYFARFELTDDDVASLRSQALLTTVGARSGDERRAVAGWLEAHAGMRVERLPDAGNSAHLDAPEALARQILDRRST